MITRIPWATWARVVGALAAIGVLSLVAAAPIGAAQARHVTIEINDSVTDPFLSETCGTEVVISAEATLNVTLVYNREGLIVREIDPAGGGTVTYSAPETGNSFSFPFQPGIIDYGEGAEVGSTFTAKFVGLFGHAPGFIASDAGQVVVTGTVEGFDENGSPILNFEQLVVEHGNRESQEDIFAAICGALTA